MATFTKIVLLLFVGFLLGAVLASAIAPGMLTWYAAPATGGALCECTALARDTVSRLLHAQLLGGSMGAVSLAVGGIVIARVRKKRAAAMAGGGGGVVP